MEKEWREGVGKRTLSKLEKGKGREQEGRLGIKTLYSEKEEGKERRREKGIKESRIRNINNIRRKGKGKGKRKE